MTALEVAVWVCPECGSRKEAPVSAPAPKCGDNTHDLTRYPDGGWVRVEQFTPHPPMVLVEVLDADPLRSQRLAGERVKSLRSERAQLWMDAGGTPDMWGVGGA